MAVHMKLKVSSSMNLNCCQLRNSYSCKRGFTTNTTIESNLSAKQDKLSTSSSSYVRPFPPNFRDISHKFEDDHPYKDIDFNNLVLDQSKIKQLANFVQTSKRLMVITGAGISTDSGIPDYRGPNGSYRNTEAWPAFSSVEPNTSHHILAKWENSNLSHIITQNVDRLHQKAGSKKVIELHGNSHHVSCLGCGHTLERPKFQQMIKDANPDWKFVNAYSRTQKEVLSRPDGDVEVSEATSFDAFQVPNCNDCGGLYKPTVVFFGDNVPKQVVANAMDIAKQADKMLVIGSSLMVYSSFRFAQTAYDNKIPLGILNMGPTRADALASLKIELPCSQALEQINKLICSTVEASN